MVSSIGHLQRLGLIRTIEQSSANLSPYRSLMRRRMRKCSAPDFRGIQLISFHPDDASTTQFTL
jgi:hypothetical protein